MEGKSVCAHLSWSSPLYHMSHLLCCLSRCHSIFSHHFILFHHSVPHLSSPLLSFQLSLPLQFHFILIYLLYLWNHSQGQHVSVPKMVQAHYTPSLIYNSCDKDHMEFSGCLRSKKYHVDYWLGPIKPNWDGRQAINHPEILSSPFPIPTYDTYSFSCVSTEHTSGPVAF